MTLLTPPRQVARLVLLLGLRLDSLVVGLMLLLGLLLGSLFGVNLSSGVGVVLDLTGRKEREIVIPKAL